jgi:uncharacterized glyoxalase superfamily protein PhnB
MAFYKAAFGAELLWHLDAGGHIVAGLSIDGAKFFLAHESPPHGTRSPASLGLTTVRIDLFVDDPTAVHRQALAPELPSAARWSNTSKRRLDRSRSRGCSEVPWWTRSVICG